MDLNAYLDTLRNKKVAVYGIGVSNIPLIRLLCAHGISVTACDRADRAVLGQTADELEKLGVTLRLGPDYLASADADIIFRSPGIRPDVPAFAEAERHGAVVTSEMELFFDVCPCQKIAVTGSDGKTTTATIIAKLLERAGRRVHLGGNIGRPLLAEAQSMRPEDVAVLELSSFQLMRMQKSAEIAVVTNLSPNHLDYHRDMEEYVAAKKNVFAHQSADGRLVLNFDNRLSAAFAAETPGRVTFFSRKSALAEGITLEDGVICVRKEGECRRVLPAEDILLPGGHNVENYMAAVAATDGLVEDGQIREFAKTFGGVEHRIELVRTLHGVRYYNDSIGTSPTRTIAGLRSFPRKVILIAGGYDKHIPYDALGPVLTECVKDLVLTGDTAPKIRAAAEQAPGYNPAQLRIFDADDLEAAVKKAQSLARSGDVVILSPASAAFDRFKNFMDRGACFKRMVNDLV